MIEDENEDHNYAHEKGSLIAIDTSDIRARLVIQLIDNTQSFVSKAVSSGDESNRLMEKSERANCIFAASLGPKLNERESLE